jgi:superfamily II DNA or RNA helicase
MTREEIYAQCVEKIAKTNCLLLEAATGTGKSKVSIDLVNYLINSQWYKDRKEINILLLVAKRVHKQTWKDEIDKWGGINHPTAKINIRMECYESMHKCTDKYYDIAIFDEVHHVGSELRLNILKALKFGYLIGLSATIPLKLKQLFKYRYHSEVVSCDIVEAINDDILPEPQILLFPLILDNRKPTEEWEINAKVKGKVFYGEYKDLWKYKKQKVHAILSLTQKQKLIEYDKLIEWFKKQTMMTRNPAMERGWLYQAGKRLEFLADCKLGIVTDILMKLAKERTITFCKTIEQAETVGEYCIHSQNAKADDIYEKFNKKKINHITAVNILNENANLVDCKYAVFCNLSSSERIYLQRIGRSLRHKSPVIILPYFQGTREQEVVEKMTEGFNKDYIKTIHSIQEI